MTKANGWIGVDLDGTLAHYSGWKGIEHIGDPIPAMLERVKRWREHGYEVRIFTARAREPAAIPPIKRWLNENGLAGVQVTNIKDFDMIELWDDRAVRVEKNTGIQMVESPAELDDMFGPEPDLDEPFPEDEYNAGLESGQVDYVKAWF